MENVLEPRGGQLEQNLSQQVEDLYCSQLGHQPSQVTCKLLDKKIAIFVENSITKPEQLLTDSGYQKLAEQVRLNINRAMRLPLKTMTEEVVQVPVIDLLIDSTIATGRTSIVAVLADIPKLQDLPQF